MNNLARLLCLSVALASAAGAAVAAEPGKWKGVQEMMEEEEFRAAGLDKLTPEELERLNDWLARFIAQDAEHIVRTDEKLKSLQSAPVRRRIAGTFKGWSGDTTFHMDNGEVWKQRHGGRYFVNLENPEVEIYRNLMGFYEMKVVATGRRVGVTRVK